MNPKINALMGQDGFGGVGEGANTVRVAKLKWQVDEQLGCLYQVLRKPRFLELVWRIAILLYYGGMGNFNPWGYCQRKAGFGKY